MVEETGVRVLDVDVKQSLYTCVKVLRSWLERSLGIEPSLGTEGQ